MVEERASIKEVNMKDYLDILNKRKWIVLLSLATVVLSTVFFAPKTPPIYVATANVSVEELSSETPLLKGITRQLRASQMKSQLRMARSPAFTKKVLKSLESEMVKSGRERGTLGEWSAYNSVGAIYNCSEVIWIEGTTILRITVRTSDPVMSRDIANTIAKVFVRENIKSRINETVSAIGYIDKQLKVFNRKLIESEEALAEYKHTEGFTTLTDREKRVSKLESEYINVVISKQIEKAKIKVLKEDLAGKEKGVLPLVSEVNNPLIERLRKELVDLEVQRSLLLRKYTSFHPKVIEVQDKIDETRQVLKEEASKGVLSKTIAYDPWKLYQDQIKNIIDQEIEVESLEIREQALLKFLEDYSKKTKDTAVKNTYLQRLIRGKETNVRIYNLLLTKKEEARIAASLEAGKVRITKEAYAPNNPLPRKTAMKYIISVMLGLVLGFSVAFLLEHMDTTLKTVDEVKFYLDQPVIGIIPRIISKEEREMKTKYLKSKVGKEEE